MRIIAGTLGGRTLPARVPEGTRPTSERVREGLGSALAARGAFTDARVLDLFAGTGALGFEALSRGARELVAVDAREAAVRGIRQNAAALGVAPQVHVHRLQLLADPAASLLALRVQEPGRFDLVFLDPPYAEHEPLRRLLQALADSDLCSERATIVLERDRKHPLAPPDGYSPVGRYRYGDTELTLLALQKQMRDRSPTP